MLRLGKVAVPFTGMAVAVPPSVPEEGLVPMATVIELVAPVTIFPLASSMATDTAGMIEAPAFVLEGCDMNASLVAGGVTLKRTLTALVRLVAVAVKA